MTVAVTIPPQAWMVERLGEGRVRAEVMIPAGASPETYEPSAQQMIALSTARLYVALGHPRFVFERRHLATIRSTHPALPIVSMAEGLDLGAGEDPVGEADPHLWLSPRAIRIASRTVARALAEVDPDGAATYQEGLVELEAEIDRVDRRVARTLDGLEGGRFLVYHPAWSWLAADYGLVQIAIESGGQEPSPRALQATLEEARSRGIRVVFVQPGFSDRAARVIANEIGGRVVVIDPLAYDWPNNLIAVAETLRAAMSSPENDP